MVKMTSQEYNEIREDIGIQQSISEKIEWLRLIIEAYPNLADKTLSKVKDFLTDRRAAYEMKIKNTLKLEKAECVTKCVAFLHTQRNKEVNAYIDMSAGYANGYVAVPPEHPYFGKNYDDVDVSVHCGLTFAAFSDAIKRSRYWQDIEIIDGSKELPNGWYVFGFDTLHCDDSLETCPREWCIEETLRLKEQLEAVSK